ncbi:hypothetical protein HMN09_00360700 [Mycena chlorophos]|uniref:Transmembrane protein n=1 Tax=Mycena chlorophos TaxID=658473 RepID=A0A8H6TJ53_MYCCL|nr:hypothetical protein HMN09_00360700 [Mycena chlorophos]
MAIEATTIFFRPAPFTTQVSTVNGYIFCDQSVDLSCPTAATTTTAIFLGGFSVASIPPSVSATSTTSVPTSSSNFAASSSTASPSIAISESSRTIAETRRTSSSDAFHAASDLATSSQSSASPAPITSAAPSQTALSDTSPPTTSLVQVPHNNGAQSNSKAKTSLPLGAVIGIAAGGLGLLLMGIACVALLLVRRRRRRRQARPAIWPVDEEKEDDPHPRLLLDVETAAPPYVDDVLDISSTPVSPPRLEPLRPTSLSIRVAGGRSNAEEMGSVANPPPQMLQAETTDQQPDAPENPKRPAGNALTVIAIVPPRSSSLLDSPLATRGSPGQGSANIPSPLAVSEPTRTAVSGPSSRLLQIESALRDSELPPQTHERMMTLAQMYMHRRVYSSDREEDEEDAYGEEEFDRGRESMDSEALPEYSRT